MLLLRYLIREIFKTQLVILFILLVIFFAQQLIRVLSTAVSQNLPSDLIFSLLGLGMPTLAQLMLPLSLFLALLLTLGKLYAESEITIMKACGLGQSTLVLVVFLLSLFTAVIATYNTFLVSPWAIQKQIDLLEQAKANPSLSSLTAGKFIGSDDGKFVIYIDSIKNEQLNQVYLFQVNQHNNIRPSIITADKGTLHQLPNNSQVLTLNNSTRYEGTALLPDFRITESEKYEAYLQFNQVNAESNKIERLSFTELLSTNTNEAKSELFWRLSLILATPLLGLIALALSKVNPRQGRFAKLLPALLIYLSYFLIVSSIKTAGENDRLDPTWLSFSVYLGFLLLAVFLNSWDTQRMYKIRRWLTTSNLIQGK